MVQWRRMEALQRTERSTREPKGKMSCPRCTLARSSERPASSDVLPRRDLSLALHSLSSDFHIHTIPAHTCTWTHGPHEASSISSSGRSDSKVAASQRWPHLLAKGSSFSSTSRGPSCDVCTCMTPLLFIKVGGIFAASRLPVKPPFPLSFVSSPKTSLTTRLYHCQQYGSIEDPVSPSTSHVLSIFITNTATEVARALAKRPRSRWRRSKVSVRRTPRAGRRAWTRTPAQRQWHQIPGPRTLAFGRARTSRVRRGSAARRWTVSRSRGVPI